MDAKFVISDPENSCERIFCTNLFENRKFSKKRVYIIIMEKYNETQPKIFWLSFKTKNLLVEFQKQKKISPLTKSNIQLQMFSKHFLVKILPGYMWLTWRISFSVLPDTNSALLRTNKSSAVSVVGSMRRYRSCGHCRRESKKRCNESGFGQPFIKLTWTY